MLTERIATEKLRRLGLTAALAACGALGALVGQAVVDAQPRPPSPTAIGVLTAEGTLLPLAKYDGVTWQALFGDGPTPGLTAAGHAAAGEQWTAHPLNGDVAFTLQIGPVVKSKWQCQVVERWTTNRAAPVIVNEGDDEAVAVAVSAGAAAAAPEAVITPYDADENRVVSMVLALVDARERERVRRRELPAAVLPEHERGHLPTVMTMMRASHPDPDSTGRLWTYHFSARKTYRKEQELRVEGWLVESREGFAFQHLRTALSRTFGETSWFWQRPVGVVRLPDRTVWVLRHDGYEGYSYALHEFRGGDNRIVMDSPVTGC